MVNDGIAISDAAAHFGVDVAQFEKDLNLLICCGLPGYTHAELIDIQFWDDGRVHVLDPQTIGAPMRLSGDEATALLVALRLLAQIPGDHDREALLSATLRLERAVGAFGTEDIVIEAGVDARYAATIDRALATGGDLHIVYGAANDEVTERIVHPLRTIAHGGSTYLEAYCRSAGALRTFRLDRLMAADVVAAPETAEVPATRTSAPDAPPIEATIAASASWAAEALGLSDTTVGDDGRIVGRVPVLDERWLVHTVLALGGAAEVQEPASLRMMVADEAAAALASYA